MPLFRHKCTLIVILNILYLHKSYCDKPDICSGSSVTAVESVTFLDGVHRYFVSSGAYYWFANKTSDLPSSQTAIEIPHGFSADAALIKDTRHCANGQYGLLLIQKRDIGTDEEEWQTMLYTLKEWGENGTDSGEWDRPVRIAHCRRESRVCTTSDKYFATMSFDFKRSLDAAFGVIGENAYFIQGSLIYNVTYKNRCIDKTYTDVIVQQPAYIKTTVTAALIESEKIVLFDREYYVELNDGLQTSEKQLSNWAQTPNNYFKACPPLMGRLASIFNDLFHDSKTRSVSILAVTFVAIMCLLFIVAVLAFVIWLSLRRKNMRLANAKTNAEDIRDSPLHEQRLLGNDVQKENNCDNNKNSNDKKQVRTRLQTSC